MADPISPTNILEGMIEPLKNWFIPLAIIIVLLLILLIVKAVQKRNSERSLDEVRKFK